MRTRLYLDVDGVLNPFRSKGPHKHWSDYKKHDTVEGYRVWRSQDMGAWLASIDLELVWATSWVGRANGSIGAPMGLPTMRTMAFDDQQEIEIDREHGNCGKLLWVRADAGKAPVVWVDDEFGPNDYRWAEEREFPTLLIKPDPAVGLRKADLVSVEDFVYTNR